MSDDLFKNLNNGSYATVFEDSLVFASLAGDLNFQKPVYLAPLLNYNQLQTLLENKHLFDDQFVNCLNILNNQYLDLKLEFES